MADKKRYVVVGTGSRGTGMFVRPLLNDFAETAELVGLCDPNAARMKAVNELLEADMATFTDFDKMMAELDPDGICVATVDSAHADYLVRGLAAGKRVYTEKPLCTTAQQCRDIAAADAEHPGMGFTTHNMRYMPAATKIKAELAAGRIGRLLSVDFVERLDRRHGASYFRRWHKFKANSGGLLIHKASHHFDVLNWLVGSLPGRLVASGAVVYYGANGDLRGDRCRDCPHAAECEFHIDLFSDEKARQLYLSAEADDGYMRDSCVFDERIDTEDEASVLYTYDDGVRVTYHLQAYSSYEGMQICLEGTEGRLEYQVTEDTSWVIGDHTEFGLGELLVRKLTYVHPRKGPEELEIPALEGSHGGSDPQLRQEFFASPWDEPAPARMANLSEAIQAVLVGVAANKSIANDSAPVNVQDLLKR